MSAPGGTYGPAASMIASSRLCWPGQVARNLSSPSAAA
jgi:hypothetical protein